MWSPRLTKQRGPRHASATAWRQRCAALCVRGDQSHDAARMGSGAALIACLCAVALLVSACGSLPFRGSKNDAPAPTVPAGGDPNRTTGAPPVSSDTAGGAAPPAAAPPSTSTSPAPEKKSRFSFMRKKEPAPAPTPAANAPGAAGTAEVPARARADWDRAVGLMRGGKLSDAELVFKQMATAYPQFAGPQINLGIIHRKANRLEQSEAALQEALERNRDNAIAWNELGVTQRMRGEFKMAQDSYENAIRIDPIYAPAYRNLGVLLDLYVGDPEGALDNLERYKELTNEDKPVTGWIAELRQRTGRPVRKQPVAPASDSAPSEGESGGAAPDAGDDGAAAPAEGNDADGAQGEAPAAPAQEAAPAPPKRAGD
jgi:Flp pilus assembly protein TadD